MLHAGSVYIYSCCHDSKGSGRCSFSSPAFESSGPQVQVLLQLLVVLTGLHVQVLEDVVFAFGADLCGWHLQRVAVQGDGLQMPEVAVTQRHVGDSVAGHVEPNERKLGYF